MGSNYPSPHAGELYSPGGLAYGGTGNACEMPVTATPIKLGPFEPGRYSIHPGGSSPIDIIYLQCSDAVADVATAAPLGKMVRGSWPPDYFEVSAAGVSGQYVLVVRGGGSDGTVRINRCNPKVTD